MESKTLSISFIQINPYIDWKQILMLDSERENVNNVNKINNEVFFIFYFIIELIKIINFN